MKAKCYIQEVQSLLIFCPDMTGNTEGLTYHSGVQTGTNDPAFTIYQKEVSSLKIYLDKNGTCVRYEQDLPRAVLETYHERFKHFQSKTP